MGHLWIVRNKSSTVQRKDETFSAQNHYGVWFTLKAQLPWLQQQSCLIFHCDLDHQGQQQSCLPILDIVVQKEEEAENQAAMQQEVVALRYQPAWYQEKGGSFPFNVATTLLCCYGRPEEPSSPKESADIVVDIQSHCSRRQRNNTA